MIAAALCALGLWLVESISVHPVMRAVCDPVELSAAPILMTDNHLTTELGPMPRGAFQNIAYPLREPVTENDILARILIWLSLTIAWSLACARWVGSFYSRGHRIAVGFVALMVGAGAIFYLALQPLF